MAKIRIGLAAVNQLPLDWEGNLGRIRAALKQARTMGIRILCFPELAISGYGCEDRFLHPDTAERSLALARTLASEIGDEVVLVGLPIRYDGDSYNGVAVMHQGAIRGITLKCHLAREGIHYEPRWFNPWPRGQEVTLDTGDAWIHMGTLIYRAGDLYFAVEICEDAWVPNPKRPCHYYRDVPLVFNASASHFSMGKDDIRERIVAESSRDFNCVYAYANLVGCESGRAIYDGELLFASDGQIQSRSDYLYLDDFKLLAWDMEPVATDREPDITMTLGPDSETPPPLAPAIRSKAHDRLEIDFARGASLALLDYLRKSKGRGFTLSLSGGVDSSTVAVLVWVAAYRLFSELSEEARHEKLAYLGPEISRAASVRDLMQHLLTCVYQATRNSGEVTRNAAESLAHAIGAKYLFLDVDALVQGYQDLISNALGLSLKWEEHDVALQNIQARVRGPGVWMLANLSGSLLLTTSNRSEVAVGYATMDGDTSGGLAPIAGVQKTFLCHWLNVMASEGLPGIPAIPSLKLVTQQYPTAELRPPGETQLDEKDLMPYEVLDHLERDLVSNRKTPLEAYRALVAQFGAVFDREALYRWTRKFCWLFTISQWKRERYAPAFHLDDRSLDPKTWARYPILAAPFKVELDELEQYFQGQKASADATGDP